MWSAVHEGRVLFFNAPGPAGALVPLPESATAVGLGPRGAAVLCADGAVLVLEPGGAVRQNRRIELPADVGRAAISADGSLVVVSTGDGRENCDVSKEENGRWGLVSTPDFLCAVTDIRCAPDGKSFGYGYRTSQPWSEYGSYGNPLRGAAVFKADGTAIREDYDTRRHNEDPEIKLAWGDGGDPLVLFITNAAHDDAEVIAI
jgi:hypothetical protein